MKEEENLTVATLWIEKNYIEEYEEYQVVFSRSFLQVFSNKITTFRNLIGFK